MASKLELLRRAAAVIRASVKPTGPSTPLPGMAFPVEGAEQLAKREAEAAALKRAQEAIKAATPAVEAGPKPTVAPVAPGGTRPIKPASARHMEGFQEQLGRPDLLTPEQLGALPGMAGRPGAIPGVNLAFVDPEESSRRVLAAILENAKGRLQRAQRGTRSMDVTERAALRLIEQGKVTPEIMASLPAGTIPPGVPVSEYSAATRQLRQSTVDVFRDLTKRAKAGEPIPDIDMRIAMAQAEAAAVGAGGTSTEVARALQAHKAVTPFDPADWRQAIQAGHVALQQRAEGMGKSLTREQLIDIGTQTDKKTFGQLVGSSANLGVDMLYEYWINWGLLSKFVSVERNALGNALIMPYHLMERTIAGQIGKVTQHIPEGFHGIEVGSLRLGIGGGGGVQAGEATAAIFGMQQAIGDAGRLAWRMGTTGESVFGTSAKFGTSMRAMSSERLGQAFGPEVADSNLGRAFDYMGNNIMRLPGTWGLRVPDEFAKTLWYRAALYMKAYREARIAGIQEGDAFEKFVFDRVTSPSFASQVDATDVAKLMTWNAELGTAGSAIRNFLDDVPGMRLIVPFFQTPVNLVKGAWQRAPILANLSIQNMSDIAAGGAARDLALARIGMSWAMLGPLVMGAQAGYITGSGASYPEAYRRALQRDYGWQPYSIYDPSSKTYISVRGLEPWSLILGMVGDYVETFKRAPIQDVETGAVALGLALSKAATQMPALAGIGGMYEAMTKPGANVQRIIRQQIGSLAPGAIAQFAQAIDPVRKEYDSVLDVFRERLGIGGSLRPMRDDYGRPMLRETPLPVVNPLIQRKVSEDYAPQEYMRNGGSPPAIPKAIGGMAGPALPTPAASLKRGVPLEPQQIERYGQLLEDGIKDGEGRTLLQALNAFEQDERFRPPEQGGWPYDPPGLNPRVAEMNRKARWFHEQARERLMDEYPDLRQKFDALQAERQAASQGQPMTFQGPPALQVPQ